MTPLDLYTPWPILALLAGLAWLALGVMIWMDRRR